MLHNNNPIISRLIGLHLPEKRPMDNVLMDLDFPQEEEFALSNLSTQSCYHWWNFPEKMIEYFEKYALLQNLSLAEYQKFKTTYLNLLKKIHLANNRKRLLLKNPVNTGRIPLLLELFPNAQFIYLHRHPNEVYHSTVKLHLKLLERFTLQKYDSTKIKKNTQRFYHQFLEKYEQDKQLISASNLIEINYRTLLEYPLDTLKEIYTHLQIPDFESNCCAFQSFIESQKSYQVDTYNKIMPVNC